jgi:adenylylsulfate reductase subunit B
MGAKLIPLRSTDSIMWTVTFRDGRIKRFKFPIRTTPEGSIKPYEGLEEPSSEDIKTQNLCTDLKRELPKPKVKVET